MDLVRNKQADMECGSTTATFSRMEQVDFSSSVFLDTTGLLVRKAAGAKSLGGLAGKRIAVVNGTTNQKALDAALKRASISASVVGVANRDEGINALQSGSVDAFASDKILLIGLAPKVKDPAQYELLQDDLGFEPYALVLPRGDAAFRLAVNRALGQIFRSDVIVEIFRGTFGADFSPSPALLVMYGLGAYPE
jgi:glutamate/aspartate transport system substrate-binding protein